MPQGPDDKAPFLSRWSRRKLAPDDQIAPDPLPAAPEADAEAQAVEVPEDESITAEALAALPSLEELTPQTDIRPFLQHGVPQALRNAALRRKWMLVPGIRDHADPAVDYAWDWNTPGGVPGDGAAPSSERSAKMLRELFAPRRTAASQETPDNMPDDPEAPPADVAVAASQHDQALTDPPLPESAAEPADPQGAASQDLAEGSDHAPATGRRRHGGALPG